MVHKKIFFILTLLLFIFSYKICFCHDTINVTEADFILDFISNADNVDVSTQEYFKSINREAFITSFNDNVSPYLGLHSGETFLPNLMDLYFYYDDNFLYFVSGINNTNRISISPTAFNASKNYKLSYDYGFSFKINSSTSFTVNRLISGGSNSFKMFYSDGVAIDPVYIGGVRQVVDTNCIGFLGTQLMSTFSLQEKTQQWYDVMLPVINCYLGTGSDNPSGDNPSPSGDGSSIDYTEQLNNINNNINEINNNLTNVPDLSGTTINSGDVENALNFNFAEDPYSNFWLELNTGLSSALTSNNRSISIDFRNETYNINLDDFSLQVPEFLKSFLSIVSTSLVVWQMIKYVKIIIDKISSGDMDTVLAMNEEERNY